MLPPGLTQRERDLLVWFYEDELSYEEIAARLKIPILTLPYHRCSEQSSIIGSWQKRKRFF